jgi:hypothetical protein
VFTRSVLLRKENDSCSSKNHGWLERETEVRERESESGESMVWGCNCNVRSVRCCLFETETQFSGYRRHTANKAVCPYASMQIGKNIQYSIYFQSIFYFLFLKNRSINICLLLPIYDESHLFFII